MWVSVKHKTNLVKLNTESVIMMMPEDFSLLLSSGFWVYLSREGYDELEKTMFPKRKAYSQDDTELAEYLNQLHRLTGGKNDAILTPQRKKKLTDLLKSMSRDQLDGAAINIGKDKWLQGDNENKKRYGDVDYLLRPDKAAKWAEYKPEDKRKSMF